MGERKRERRAEKRERRERTLDRLVYAASAIAVPIVCAIIYAVASSLPPHQE